MKSKNENKQRQQIKSNKHELRHSLFSNTTTDNTKPIDIKNMTGKPIKNGDDKL